MLCTIVSHVCLSRFSSETPLQVFNKLMLFTLLMIFVPFSAYFASKYYVFEGKSVSCSVHELITFASLRIPPPLSSRPSVCSFVSVIRPNVLSRFSFNLGTALIVDGLESS